MANDTHNPGTLEQIGCNLLDALGDINSTSEISQKELKAIATHKRKYVSISALIGALSALISAAAAVGATYAFQLESTALMISPTLYYTSLWGITCVCVVIEILLLYRYGLKAAHNIAQEAGTPLTGGVEGMLGNVARAALEIPNPKKHSTGIDPAKYADKKKLFLLGLLYKAKVLLTNAIAKIIVSKALIRGGVRSWIEFVAVPVTAVWNGWIAHRIMEEVQLRAIGPKLIKKHVAELLQDDDKIYQEVLTRLTACSVTTSLTLHPNLLFLLTLTKTDKKELVDIDSKKILTEKYTQLNDSSKKKAARFLCVASIADNRYRSKEAGLVREIFQLAKISTNPIQLNTLKKQFCRGEDMSSTLDQLVPIE